MVKLLDFWAPWCGPCLIMNPILEEIEKELAGKFEIEKINVDENPEKTSQYGVMSIPTYIIEKDGKYYMANVPSLAGCFTQAGTIKKLMKNTQEVIGICFGLKKEFERTEFMGVEAIEVDL